MNPSIGLTCVLCLLSVYVALAGSADSPSSWKSVSGTPILLGQRGSKKYYSINGQASWQDSLEYCHQNHLNSIQIESQTELEFVGSILRKKSWKYNYFWTSGHDFYSEGHYKWMRTNKLIDLRMNNLFGNSTQPRRSNCVQLSVKNPDVNVLFDFSCADANVQPLCET